jgi:hypothetical protein
LYIEFNENLIGMKIQYVVDKTRKTMDTMLTMFEAKNTNMDLTEEYIAKLRNCKKTLLKVLIAKKDFMDEEEKLEFLELDDNLYCWTHRLNPHMTIKEITTKGRHLIKSYGQNVIL